MGAPALPPPDIKPLHPDGRVQRDWYDWFRTLQSGGGGGLEGFVSVKDFGAVGDNVTDDTAAIQTAIDEVSDFNGGIVYFPPGNPYLVTATITVPDGVTLLGAGVFGSSIMARTDINIIHVTGHFAQIVNMAIIGKGSNQDTGTFGATTAAVSMNGVSARMSHCQVTGGAPCIQVGAGDTYLEDVTVYQSYSNSLVLINSTTFCTRGKFDHLWPVVQPNPGFSVSVWAPSTAYSVGDVREISQAGATWYVQCSVAGTSGGSQPTLLNYGLPIVDNTATWLLVGRNDLDGIVVAASEFHCTTTDLSGATRFGVLIIGSAQQTWLHQMIIGQCWRGAINAVLGQHLYITEGQLAVGLQNGGTGITIGGSWSGDTSINANTIFGTIGTFCNGVDVAGAVDARITDNFFRTCDNGVIVRANINSFIIAHNSFRSCSFPVNINAGSSDFYNVVNNLIVTSGAIIDGGSGANKTLTGNV